MRVSNGVIKMYQVEYGYYNYPKKIRYFQTYESARKYFHYIGKQKGVKKVELTVQEALRQ
jgi:ABC-type transport system involved in cytochrome c biogenesis ATPase subunit